MMVDWLVETGDWVLYQLKYLLTILGLIDDVGVFSNDAVNNDDISF